MREIRSNVIGQAKTVLVHSRVATSASFEEEEEEEGRKNKKKETALLIFFE